MFLTTGSMFPSRGSEGTPRCSARVRVAAVCPLTPANLARKKNKKKTKTPSLQRLSSAPVSGPPCILNGYFNDYLSILNEYLSVNP